MVGNEVTGAVSEDGALVIKDKEGKEVRYVLETDLLAVKGSRVSKDDVAKQVEGARVAGAAEATQKLEIEHQKALQAEARVTSLQEQFARGGGSAAELAKATADLATVKKNSEILGNKYLELRRDWITKTYNIPKATVDSKKTEQELELYEEALRAVIGSRGVGNFAVGGSGGGTSPIQGKSPHQLAVDAYATSK